jgi:type II secretory pathway predicted ATPase ExeA
VKIPALGEKRERELRDLIKKGKKPVVLFVDEAHDLHPSTLIGLKRLIQSCMVDGAKLLDVLTVEAIELLSQRLRTPLQIQQHLMLAMEAAYQVGEKPATGLQLMWFQLHLIRSQLHL